MSLELKLKPNRNITGLLIPLTLLPIFGLASLTFGIETGLHVLAGALFLFTLFYLVIFVRTKSVGQLFLSVYAAFLGVMILINWVEKPEFKLAYYTGITFFAALLIYMAVTRRLKWRGSEVFELAAENVEESENGYTKRPRPVGKVEYNPQQLRTFAAFAARNLIALTYSNAQNITLVPVKMGDEYGRVSGLSGDYRDASWINFDMDGNVSVHISQKDYLDYRQPLGFDQLCTSLGQLFIDFLDLCVKGEGVRIIDRMDELKLGIFS